MIAANRPNRPSSLALIGLAALLASATVHADDKMPANDLRTLRVGASLADTDTDGLIDLACADAPDTRLSAWSDYPKCPRNRLGLHAVSFHYDDSKSGLAQLNDNAQGTKVAGQPALLQLWIGDTGIIGGLSIATDPSARLYARRRAYLFGLQAKARYGDEGWHCTQQQPTPTEQPIGTTFVKEHCEKDADGRHFTMDRDLHHDPAKDLSQFVSSSSVLILASSQQPAKQ